MRRYSLVDAWRSTVRTTAPSTDTSARPRLTVRAPNHATSEPVNENVAAAPAVPERRACPPRSRTSLRIVHPPVVARPLDASLTRRTRNVGPIAHALVLPAPSVARTRNANSCGARSPTTSAVDVGVGIASVSHDPPSTRRWTRNARIPDGSAADHETVNGMAAGRTWLLVRGRATGATTDGPVTSDAAAMAAVGDAAATAAVGDAAATGASGGTAPVTAATMSSRAAVRALRGKRATVRIPDRSSVRRAAPAIRRSDDGCPAMVRRTSPAALASALDGRRASRQRASMNTSVNEAHAP